MTFPLGVDTVLLELIIRRQQKKIKGSKTNQTKKSVHPTPSTRVSKIHLFAMSSKAKSSFLFIYLLLYLY